MTLTVEYFHVIPQGAANIMWRGRFPMRSGRFPLGHPVGGAAAGEMQLGDSEQMRRFRSLGYWASCFPEGDGITLNVPEGRDAKQVARDITDCFGWSVRIKRA